MCPARSRGQVGVSRAGRSPTAASVITQVRAGLIQLGLGVRVRVSVKVRMIVTIHIRSTLQFALSQLCLTPTL